MPKNRKRAAEKGAKSIPVLTKFKLGTRKSSQGIKQMSNVDLGKALHNVRKRDRNMLQRMLTERGLIDVSS